jgi:hypothetical protein
MVKRAVLIGIDQYEDPAINDLSGCVNDVNSMAAVLGECYQFEPAGLTRLTDPGDTTRKKILDALTRLVDETGPGDVAVIYYSGHGSQAPDTDRDEEDKWDETIVPSDSGRSENREVLDIIDDELHSYMAALAQRTSYATFIFDSCHSGSIDRDLIRPGTVQALKESARPVPRATLPSRKPLAVPPRPFPGAESEAGAPMSASGLIRQGDYLLIAGCHDDEVSLEADFDEPHGLLTNYLAAELRTGAAATMKAILAKVGAEVEEEARRREKCQRPVFEGPQALLAATPFGPVGSSKEKPAGKPGGAAAPAGDGAQGALGAPSPDAPGKSEDGGDDSVKIREWDAKFAGRCAAGIVAILLLAGLVFGVLTFAVLDGQDSSTKVAVTIVVELLFVGLLLGSAGIYIALLDQRGRSHALENVLVATTGTKSREIGIGTDEIKGAFEALGKMPTARGLIAIGGLVVVGAIALAWHVLPESQAGKAPAISKQPTSVKSRPGGKALFSVSAEGDGLDYEWQRNGTAINTAADSPTLGIQAIKRAENGDIFNAVVSNGNGETVSDNARLTVVPKNKKNNNKKRQRSTSRPAAAAPTALGYTITATPLAAQASRIALMQSRSIRPLSIGLLSPSSVTISCLAKPCRLYQGSRTCSHRSR